MKIRFTSIIFTVIITILLFNLTACSHGKPNNNSSGKDTVSVNIASLKGPTSIGLVKLYSDSDSGLTVNKYNYNIYGTADEISTGLIKGEIDIAAIPCNLASVLYNKTQGEILIAAVNTLGVLYIVENGNTISDIKDLKGQTLYSTGQGTTPEYTLRYILSKNGIDPDRDINIVYCSEASEVVSAISSGNATIGMLPQPYVTVAQNKIEGLRIALDITEEWEQADKDSTVVTGVTVVQKEFAQNNPKAVQDFINEYRNSAEFANAETDACALLLEKYDIFKAEIAKKAIPQCNVVLYTGEEMNSKVLAYLSVLYNANPSSIGGKLPDNSIFYTVQ